MGLTTGGTIGAETALSLADCPRLIRHLGARRQIAAQRHHRPLPRGPIATPEDAQYILDSCELCDGFYGASSMERLPTEMALTERTRQFRALTRKNVKQPKEVRA